MPKGIYNHRPHSRETIEKIKQSNLGKKRSIQTRKNVSLAMRKWHKKNPKYSLERRKKLSEWMKINNPMFVKKAQKKISQSQMKERNNNWKGGISNQNNLFRGSPEYKKWRTAVFRKDNWTCQKCSQKGVYLEAHHLIRFSKNQIKRLDLSNGITLCKKCHKEEHS